MLGIFMAMRYWPFSTAAAVSERPSPFCRRPMTILVSMMLMMLMAELLRVMGTPMSRICLMICPLEEGTSRDSFRFRWVTR